MVLVMMMLKSGRAYKNAADEKKLRGKQLIFPSAIQLHHLHYLPIKLPNDRIGVGSII
jgi:hypothetical protein